MIKALPGEVSQETGSTETGFRGTVLAWLKRRRGDERATPALRESMQGSMKRKDNHSRRWTKRSEPSAKGAAGVCQIGKVST